MEFIERYNSKSFSFEYTVYSLISDRKNFHYLLLNYKFFH
jgi:hypothetical protein